MILSRNTPVLEDLLNRNLQASLTARRTAADLEGKTMDLGVSATDPLLRISVEGGRLSFSDPDETQPAVVLAGDLPRLLQLLGGDHSGPGLDLRGDPAVAEGFAGLLKHCRPSPEEELARFTSDTFARQAGDAVRAAMDWTVDAAGSVRRNVRDFVQEEARFLPTRVEFDTFSEEVERLRDSVDRASARLSALAKGPKG